MSDHGLPDLLEYVEEDSELSPAEKETTFAFDKTGEDVTGYTAEAGLTRRLLAHPHVRINAVTVSDGDARRDVEPEAFDTAGPIVGCRFTATVGLISIKSSARSSTAHSDMVSHRVLGVES